MNALQVIPPKRAMRVHRAALLFRVSGAILLQALVGGMSMSRGEEGTSSEPGAVVVTKDSGDKTGGNHESPSVTQPIAVPTAATTDGSGSGRSDEGGSASAQPIAPSATSTPDGIKNDPTVGSEAGKSATADPKSNAAATAAINDRGGSRTLAKLSTIPPSSAASKNDLARKPEDARVLKRAPSAIDARSAESFRRAYQSRSEVDYRSWKSPDRLPGWVGSPPITYRPSPKARTPYIVAPADGMKRQDWMSLAANAGMWEHVVEAPGAVLNGGKQALYAVLGSVW
jgi:hypothetical protein